MCVCVCVGRELRFCIRGVLSARDVHRYSGIYRHFIASMLYEIDEDLCVEIQKKISFLSYTSLELLLKEKEGEKLIRLIYVFSYL